MNIRIVLIAVLLVLAILGVMSLSGSSPKQPPVSPPVPIIHPEPAKVVPPVVVEPKPALPEYQPPEVKDLALAKLIDRRAKQSERIFPDMTSRFPAVTDPADQRALAKALEDPMDDDTARNEIANLLRRSNYPQLDASLLRVLQNPEEKERFRAFAAQHVGVSAVDGDENKKNALVPELRTMLGDKDISVRREALLALVRVKDDTGRETAIKWLKEDSPEAVKIRDLAIRCIRELGLKEYLPEVRVLGKSQDEATCIAAIVTLSEWKDEDSRPLFESAAQSKVVRVQRAGQVALKRME